MNAATKFTILVSKRAVIMYFGLVRPRTTNVAACRFTTAGSTCVVTAKYSLKENKPNVDSLSH
ncbi:hypothetical protein NP493_14g07066 [Ridgeia piscesae]|uniref:Uncharacterized protein n=1 Tax=Ridgeia piscesae TaxID=27915 RepID=A0AAD9PE54_RIDPI|nr:hypothetical protein NP493_14g07066 [Ridgeia piscesae]